MPFALFRWVAEKTQQKITDIISEPVPSGTIAVMASALYFKGQWEKTFIPGGTGPYVHMLENKLLFCSTYN